MFHKITSLATLPDYILLVGFSGGEFKQFDLKPLMGKYPAFAALENVEGLYRQAKIDVGGYGVVWNDDLDISAEGLYEKGVDCAPPDDIEQYRQKLLAALIKARKSANLSQKQLEILFVGMSTIDCKLRLELNQLCSSQEQVACPFS